VIVVELQFAANLTASLARNRQGVDLAESTYNPALFIFAWRADTHAASPAVSKYVEVGPFLELPAMITGATEGHTIRMKQQPRHLY